MRNLSSSIIALLVIVSGPLHSQLGPLKQLNGPDLGSAYAMERDRNGVVYLLTIARDLYRSSDDGETWQLRLKCPPVRPVAVAVDSLNAVVLALTTGGVMRSTDGGTSWSNHSDGLANQVIRGVSVPFPNIWLLATSSGFFRWTVGNPSWTACAVDFSSPSVYAYARGAGAKVFAGLSSGRVSISSDSGATWSLTAGVTGWSGSVRYIQCSADGTVFASVINGTFRSVDNGATWEKLDQLSYGILAVDDTGSVYMATGTSVYQLNSAGSAGTLLTQPEFDMWSTSGISVHGSTIVIGTTRGIFSSSDHGATWSDRNSGFRSAAIDDITIDDQGNLYAAGGAGIQKSTDGGTTWTTINSGTMMGPVYSIHYSFNGYLLAGSTYGLFRSTDRGASWTPSSSGLTPSTVDRIVEDHRGWLFCNPIPGGLARSTDNGLSWKQIHTGLTQPAGFDVSVGSTGIVYALYRYGGPLYKSINDGDLFGPVFSGRTDLWTIEAVGPEIVLAGTTTGDLLRSTDGGTSFVTTALGVGATGILEIRNGGNGLFLAGSDKGLFRSNDSGATWEAIDSSEAPALYFPISFDSSSSVYVGVWGRGIFSAAGPNTKILVSASDHDFGEVPSYAVVNAEIGVTTHSLRPLVVDSVTNSDTAFSTTISPDTILPFQARALTLHFTALPYGTHEDTLEIWSNASSSPLRFPVRANVPRSRIVVTPTQLAFGSVTPHTTKPHQFSIYDSSVSSLQIDSLRTGTPYFEVVQFLADFIVRQSTGPLSLNVYFTPDSTRSYLDTLRIFNNSLVNPYVVPITGSGVVTRVEDVRTPIPTEYSLSPNFPNPFNPSTTITLALPERSHVRLAIYTMLGQCIEELANGEFEAGFVIRSWSPRGTTGMYVCRAEAVSTSAPGKPYIETMKLLFVK